MVITQRLDGQDFANVLSGAEAKLPSLAFKFFANGFGDANLGFVGEFAQGAG